MPLDEVKQALDQSLEMLRDIEREENWLERLERQPSEGKMLIIGDLLAEVVRTAQETYESLQSVRTDLMVARWETERKKGND